MKSLLLVPGDSPSRLQAALDSEAHAVIVELDDRVVVSPEARQVVRGVLERSRACVPRRELVVKVGSLLSNRIEENLDLVMAVAPDAVLLPKVVGGTDIQHLAAKLAVREAEHGLANGGTRIIGLVADTPRGVLALGTIAGASGRLAGLGWRAEAASAASLNATDRLARALTLVAAAAAEVDAIDAATPGLDLEALARDCAAARHDGFAAKLAGDASHVSVINAA